MFRRIFSNHSQCEEKLINLNYCKNSPTFEPLLARQSLKMIYSSSSRKYQKMSEAQKDFLVQ